VWRDLLQRGQKIYGSGYSEAIIAFLSDESWLGRLEYEDLEKIR